METIPALPKSKFNPSPLFSYEKVAILLQGYALIYEELRQDNTHPEYDWIRQTIQTTLDSFHEQP